MWVRHGLVYLQFCRCPTVAAHEFTYSNPSSFSGSIKRCRYTTSWTAAEILPEIGSYLSFHYATIYYLNRGMTTLTLEILLTKRLKLYANSCARSVVGRVLRSKITSKSPSPIANLNIAGSALTDKALSIITTYNKLFPGGRRA